MANQNANCTHNSKGSVRIQPVSMIVFCRVSSSSHLVTKCKDGWHESSSSEAKTSGGPLLAAYKPLPFHVGGGGAFCHLSLFWPADVCPFYEEYYNISYHTYADDTQLYITVSPHDYSHWAKNYRPNQKPVWNLLTLDTEQLVHSLLFIRLEYCDVLQVSIKKQ